MVLGLPRKLKVKVEGGPERFFKNVRADVAFVCTSSHLKEVEAPGAALLARRINVVTTCEELVHPIPERAAAFKELDQLAEAQEGVGARHRREPRLRDGRAGADAHRALRARAAAWR